MAFNTGKPVEPNGSTDPRDLKDNAAIIDKLVNSSDLTWLGRLRKTLKTWAGMTADFMAAQLQRTNDFQAFLQNISFETPVNYAAGISITRSTQTVLYNGQTYRPRPEALPFVTTTFPADSAKWLLFGDSSLRQDLAATTGAGRSGFDSVLEYAPATVGFELAKLARPGATKQQRTFTDFDIQSNLGNLDALNSAILGGTVQVGIVGDSIIEGLSEKLYDNSLVALMMRTLRAQNPTLKFEFANFSLAGRGIATFFDANYKGIAGPDDAASGFYRAAGGANSALWPGGSVIGKAWRDHLRDFAPDLVLYFFGANDLSGSGPIGQTQYKIALDYQETWPKVPSTVLATAALPSVAAGYQNEVQVSADTARGVARERGLTVIDINRLFHAYRYGTDIDNCFYVRSDGFAGYPAGWTVETGTTFTPFGSNGYEIRGQGRIMRSVQSQDINVSVKFTMPDWTAQTGNIIYRSKGTIQTQYMAQITSNSLSLYWGTTIIKNVVLGVIPNGTEVTLQVDVRGQLHRIYVNGVLMISISDYSNLRSGTHGLLTTGGSARVYELIAHLGNPYSVGTPQLTDVDIYGYSPEEFASNPNSLGGNGVNHETKIATTVIWAAACLPLIRHIRNTRAPFGGNSFQPVRMLGSGNFAVAGTTVAMEIDGLVGNAISVVMATGAAWSACDDARIVAGGRSVKVQVFHSPGVYFLINDVVLPAGSWLIRASAVFSKDGAATPRNTMVITGTRVA